MIAPFRREVDLASDPTRSIGRSRRHGAKCLASVSPSRTVVKGYSAAAP
jgi:hypothetical protein